ncbi:YciI family protein [Kibdelosporangium philippinense]|uniref:YciI family protein n=1 Tax=Kibdelosporangium philippinense TaxID=211113 RepID=A0ABS8ZBP7_9PSEU|nr:YciI family protein [Kibdelosporangium philippinense]MCE7005279.1 YciI family protein [Kibdelosporangium philippinense]
MAWYTADVTYTTDRDKLDAVRPAHRDYLRGLVDRGLVVAAGPFADDLGGFVVYQVEDRVQLDKLLAEDPYSTDGVVAKREVREWNIRMGSWLPKTQ